MQNQSFHRYFTKYVCYLLRYFVQYVWYLELVRHKYPERFTSARAQVDVPYTGTILQVHHMMRPTLLVLISLDIQIKYFLQYFAQYVQYFLRYSVQYVWYVYKLWLVQYKYQKRFPSTRVHNNVLYNDVLHKNLFVHLVYTSQSQIQQQVLHNVSFNYATSSFQSQYIDKSEFELHSTLDNYEESDNNSSIDYTNTDDAGDIVIAAIAKQLKATNRHVLKEESNLKDVKLSFIKDVYEEESKLKAKDDMQEETSKVQATEIFSVRQWLHLETVFNEESIKDVKDNKNGDYLWWKNCKYNILLVDLAFDSNDNTLDVSVFFKDYHYSSSQSTPWQNNVRPIRMSQFQERHSTDDINSNEPSRKIWLYDHQSTMMLC